MLKRVGEPMTHLEKKHKILSRQIEAKICNMNENIGNMCHCRKQILVIY